MNKGGAKLFLARILAIVAGVFILFGFLFYGEKIYVRYTFALSGVLVLILAGIIGLVGLNQRKKPWGDSSKK